MQGARHTLEMANSRRTPNLEQRKRGIEEERDDATAFRVGGVNGRITQGSDALLRQSPSPKALRWVRKALRRAGNGGASQPWAEGGNPFGIGRGADVRQVEG